MGGSSIPILKKQNLGVSLVNIRELVVGNSTVLLGTNGTLAVNITKADSSAIGELEREI